MRVTSASASINSLQASAASRALCEPLRSEPGKTRIFGAAIRIPDYEGRATDDRISGLASAVVRPLPSMLAVDPHARRRNVGPDALGRLRLDAVERARNRRIGRIGELDERSARRHQGEGFVE